MDVRPDPVDGLVERYLPLVRAAARRYAGCGEPFDDLVQAGSVGLVAAARRFDPGRGVPFAAYAAATVEGELRRHLRDRVSTIRIPRKEQERTAALRRSAQAVAQQLGHEASLAETAKAAGIALDDARVALAGPVVSVPLSALEPHPSTAAADEFAACEDRQLVQELFSTLAPREQALVRLRFGEDLSQAEIGRLLDISQSQTSRLLSAALDKLRESAERSDPWAA